MNGLTSDRLTAALRDVRYAARALRRSPWFTTVAILTLGLGIGANTAIFSVINSVLIAPLPYDGAGRLVLIRHAAPLAGQEDFGVSIQELYDYRARLASLDEVVEFHQMDFDLLRRGDPDRVSTGVVSPNFFDVLGIRPILGRTFVVADDRPGAEAVLVLGHAYWRSRFGADPDIVGQVLEMNDRPHTVIGVLPAVPLFPNEVDVYMPTSACPFRAAAEAQIARNRRAFSILQVFGSLRAGLGRAAADAEVAAAGRDLAREFPEVYRPDESGFQAGTLGVREALTRQAQPMLILLLGITALVLLIACANVANLMLARALGRDHERATRSALGAGRWHLLSQPLAEGLLVAIGGAVVGLGLAWTARGLLESFVERFTPRAGEIAIEPRVLVFTLVVSVVTGVLLGILPALGARDNLSGAMKAGTKSGGEAPHRRRLQQTLVVAQVAVSVVLLAGAGLLLASVLRLQNVDPGYRGDRVMSAEIFANFSKYATGASRHRLYHDVLDRLETAPGVVSAAITNAVPLAGLQPGQTRFRIDGDAAGSPELAPAADVRIASPGYFATLGIPLRRGRLFNPLDHESSDRVVIVNDAVSRYWNGRDPIGSRVSADDGRTWLTVVGMVGNVRQFGLEREAIAQVYLPLAQAGGNLAGRLLVRTAGDPSSAVPVIRAAVHGVDPDMPIESVQTLDAIRAAYLATPRLTALLLSIFATLALGVTLTGIAGVIASSVSQRTRDIGVRMALGASRAGVLGMVLRQGLGLVAIGLTIGVPLAFALGWVLRGYLFETAPADPIVLVTVVAAFVATGTLACLGSAYRAASIDPSTALRTD